MKQIKDNIRKVKDARREKERVLKVQKKEQRKLDKANAKVSNFAKNDPRRLP